jgi:hypothetical protein
LPGEFGILLQYYNITLQIAFLQQQLESKQ